MKTVNVQNASNLENLSFESCYKLHRVSLGQPIALKDVKIIGAPNLEKIEGIESAGNTVHVEIKDDDFTLFHKRLTESIEKGIKQWKDTLKNITNPVPEKEEIRK